jgi:hypothetical protein
MLPNPTLSMIDFAVLVAEPPSTLPMSVSIALSLVCIVAVGWALRSEKKSGASPRMSGRRQRTLYPEPGARSRF